MPESKFYTHITAEIEGNRGVIRIVDTISEYGTASSASVRDQVDRLIAARVTSTDVYLNSRGGDVFEGSEIERELKRLPDVLIIGGTIVASSASKLLAKFRNRVSRDTQVMIHRPRLYAAGDIMKLESDMKLLRNMTEEYKTAYAEKTGKTPDFIESLWAKGDYWMTAQEAKELGFVDEIENAEAPAITAEDIAILQACGAPVIPALPKPKNTTSMDRVKLIALLGLDATATDAQIEAALSLQKTNADAHTTAQASAVASQQTRAQVLVTAAHRDKKVSDAEVPHLIALAVNDFPTVEALIAGRSAIPALSGMLNTQTPGPGAADTADIRADWTLEDYLDKDPAALERIEAKHPDVFKRLNEAYFSATK